MTEKPTVVFLHIPKTAGQTIHSELVKAFGQTEVSPVRVHTQVPAGQSQLPAGYQLYSGHIDWEALESVSEPRFTFTVLRDPLERIASFYFYLRRQAEKLDEAALQLPSNTGMLVAAKSSPDEYFFGGDRQWQNFIRDHYFNPYCSYLTTRRIRGGSEASQMDADELVNCAAEAAKGLSGIYMVNDLGRLESELFSATGIRIAVAKKYLNAGEQAHQPRWPMLRDIFVEPASVSKIEELVEADQLLIERFESSSSG